MTTDDRALHQRVVGGDENALGELHERLYPLVLGLALRITRDRAVAEDIVQEVFVTFWERPLAFDPDKGTLRSWLATIAHRRAVDHVRTEERRRVSALAPRLAEPDDPSPLEEWVLAADEAARVRRAVSDLPGEIREAIELAYYRGRTYRQAAEELGLPEGTVKSRIRLGLRRLAGELAEEEL
ncbi:sigma-70 family RNA polymerase sigma factor [Sphaerisporangium fuscum]|uniref:sigma-70 family RNA polymerase sigma factor n=1 Tax=Sphaerisporangium fuscum TaxID=2835868 RepID=UPI001BDD87E1|nr:sigma-70 family RNA polymerase sigma factor [Sphaerisporangium fuscum]